MKCGSVGEIDNANGNAMPSEVCPVNLDFNLKFNIEFNFILDFHFVLF